MEPAQLVDHPVGRVGSHTNSSSIRTDREDMGGAAQSGHGHPTGVRGEGNVLHRARCVPPVEGVEVVDRGEGGAKWMGDHSEEVEVVAELVGGEEQTAAGVPGHGHDRLGVSDKVGDDPLGLGVGDVDVLRLLPARDVHHVQDRDHSTVNSIQPSSMSS